MVHNGFAVDTHSKKRKYTHRKGVTDAPDAIHRGAAGKQRPALVSLRTSACEEVLNPRAQLMLAKKPNARTLLSGTNYQ